MNELYDWCVVKYGDGINHSARHNFKKYITFWRKREVFRCICGLKISKEIYLDYLIYLDKRDKLLSKWMETNL